MSGGLALLSAIGSAFGAASSIKGFFSKPKTPGVPGAPQEDPDAVADAQRRQKARAFEQRGRASTLLSRRGAVGDDTGVATKRLLGGG